MVFSCDKRYRIKRVTYDFKPTHNRPRLSDETLIYHTLRGGWRGVRYGYRDEPQIL